jgi:hypothetical protein
MIEVLSRDLALTNSIIWVLLVVTHTLVSVVLFLLWRMFVKVEAKVDTWLSSCFSCKKDLLTKEDFKEWVKAWMPGREDLWLRVNKHTHDKETGKVIVND